MPTDVRRLTDDVALRLRLRLDRAFTHPPAGQVPRLLSWLSVLLGNVDPVTNSGKGGPRPGHARRARLPSAPDAGRSRRELTGKGVFSCERPESGRDLSPSWHTELLAKHVAMRLGRPRGDPEALADLFVRAAERDQLDHLSLPHRQRELRV